MLVTAVVVLSVFSNTVYANSVTTICGRSVSHSHPSPDWTSIQKNDIKNNLIIDFPFASVIGEATKSYNCHSYAWGGSSEWIDNPGAYIDSYEFDASEGHYLTYLHCLTYSPSHSAVDCDPPDFKAKSKWGNLCLMYHDWDYVLDGRPCSGGGSYVDYGDVTAIYELNPICCGDFEDCTY